MIQIYLLKDNFNTIYMATKTKQNINIAPLGDRVLVESEEQKDKEKKSVGGIIIPATEKEERVDRGKVIAVGSGRVDKAGNLVPMNVKVGNKVLFQWGDKVKIDDKEYFIVSETSILAIIN